MTEAKVCTIKLNDGVDVPVLAFGTGTAQAWTNTTAIVKLALEKGYRHFDCAWHYKNCVYTGRAIKQSGVPREEIFITCKIGSFEDDPADFDVRTYLYCILKDLHADILVGDLTKAWRGMEQAKKVGLARSIGVSNCSTKSLEQILTVCEIKPSVNQIEFHPYSLPTYKPTLIPLCLGNDIKIAAYASLMSLVRHQGGPVDGVVQRISQERGNGETEGQILLRWSVQTSGGIVITTSSKAERMEEQLQPFLLESCAEDLSAEQLEEISKAGRAEPFRFWGKNWPYFMKGEGGIQACHEDATHRKKPDINGGRGW
uniref:NADP-dependent oxidoreductase domain-containing protein n=1 Tax=Kwoniella dejecticola CBS 10117 TaxID=1296121 RepID=A0A1A5ZXY9_9TREE|nr:uncharacterized protein I303_07435 [Kwoniella dejecticola CBS 10117]OBR82671.1 hypothetical protein I303_07435 [Kwoniella dejecticola CBS 10117]